MLDLGSSMFIISFFIFNFSLISFIPYRLSLLIGDGCQIPRAGVWVLGDWILAVGDLTGRPVPPGNGPGQRRLRKVSEKQSAPFPRRGDQPKIESSERGGAFCPPNKMADPLVWWVERNFSWPTVAPRNGNWMLVVGF
jgi:hypothetical protein